MEFCKIFLTWCSKLFSLCPEQIFEEIYFFVTKSSKFSVVFRLWGKPFGFLGKIILLGCQNCFKLSRVCFWKSLFFKTNSLFFFFILVFGHKFSRLRRKFCNRIVKTAFFVSSWCFWLDCFFYKIFWVFPPSSGCEEKILALWCKNFKKCVKMQFMWTKKFCGKFDFWRKNVCNFFEYWTKSFRTFVKTCWAREKFWVSFFPRKKFMSSYGSWGRKFLVFGENFRQVRQKCTLCVRMRFLIELFFPWIFWVSSLFPYCGQDFLQHWRKNFRKVVKSAFHLNNKLFEESVFFEENIYFCSFFEIWCKTLRTSVGKPSPRFEKLLSTLVQGIFLDNIIFFLEKILAYKLTLMEKVWNFVKIFWHGGENCFLCVQRTFLKKKFSFSQNLQIFQLFSDFEENISDFWRK